MHKLHLYSKISKKNYGGECGTTENENEFSGLGINSSTYLHWDGKLFPNASGTEKYDRLAIIISSGATDKIIGAPFCRIPLEKSMPMPFTVCYLSGT